VIKPHRRGKKGNNKGKAGQAGGKNPLTTRGLWGKGESGAEGTLKSYFNGEGEILYTPEDTNFFHAGFQRIRGEHQQQKERRKKNRGARNVYCAKRRTKIIP